MTNPSDRTTRPQLDADDPRISEWIDGRLAVAEAAEVERAVRESPALTRLVADLRALKEAARLVPVVSPPEGFVDRVLGAVASAGGAAPGDADAESDRVVEREWRAVEAERIAEERAEAEADVAEALMLPRGAAHADSRGTWPWLAVGAALAAGVLVTVVLNRRDDAPREIAQVTAQPEQEQFAADRSVATPAAGEVSPSDALLAARPPAGDAGLVKQPSLRSQQDEPPALAAREAAPAGRDLQANGMLRPSESAAAKAAADLDELAAPKPAAAAGLGAPPDRPTVVKVGSWTDFDRLLEAHGIEAKPLADREEGRPADASGDWTLELTGPPAAIDAFLAAAGERGPERRRAVAADEADKAEGAPVRRDATTASAARKREEEALAGSRRAAGRVLIQLVIDPQGEPNPGPESEERRE